MPPFRFLRALCVPWRRVLPRLGWSFALLAGAADVSAATASRPNIVLFLVDDMGWGDSGVYGSTYYETPRIDAFAGTGLRFTQAYANPLCSPTRASILSGKSAARHGIVMPSGHVAAPPPGFNYNRTEASPAKAVITPVSRCYLDPAEHTLAEALREAGYRTALIGKWHLGLAPEHWPNRQGFDMAFHCAPDPGPPSYFSPYRVRAPGSEGTGRQGTITDGPPGEYIVDRQAEEAVEFIRAGKDRPFFLFLSAYGVHGPWGHKEAYTERFAAKTDPRGVHHNPIMGSMLQSIDECFGRILDELQAQGQADNTIVIFLSDNGGNTKSDPGQLPEGRRVGGEQRALAESWRKWAKGQVPTNNAPLREGKGKLYEGGVRVPMIWSWPGRIPANAVTEVVGGDIDVYPTLLELAGVTAPSRQIMDGVSLAGVLTGLQPALERPYFIYNPAHDEVGQISVRLGDYKLIRSYSPQWPSQLYNLREDLGETRNLAAERPEKLAELSALIDRFFAQTGAPVPRPNPRYRPVEGTAGAVEDEDGQPSRPRQRKASQPAAKPSADAL